MELRVKPSERKTFYLSESQLEIWDEIVKLPEYNGPSDVFRDMLRTFARMRGVLNEDGTLNKAN